MTTHILEACDCRSPRALMTQTRDTSKLSTSIATHRYTCPNYTRKGSPSGAALDMMCMLTSAALECSIWSLTWGKPTLPERSRTRAISSSTLWVDPLCLRPYAGLYVASRSPWHAYTESHILFSLLSHLYIRMPCCVAFTFL
jgi:hypothetical protein